MTDDSGTAGEDYDAQLWGVIDPSGGLREIIQLATGPAEGLLSVSAEARRDLRAHADGYRALMASGGNALRHLPPRGWYPFAMRTAALDDAVRLMVAGDERGADELLADEWDDPERGLITTIVARVRAMWSGYGDRDTEALFAARARLLDLAREHHAAGRYDASIPIIHAQMEGITIDVAEGLKLFTKNTRRKADVVDATQFATVEAALAVLLETYNSDVPVTQSRGSISRHGIAHGRELAYDTRINSAKSWSALGAVVEWAQPLATALAEGRRAQREGANAGSDETDEEGRRLDRREFRQTRDVLTLLGTSTIGHARSRGSLRTDIVGGVYTDKDLANRGLPLPHGIKTTIAESGTVAWYSRRTISGWVLAYAVALHDDVMHEWFYADSDDPTGPPPEDPRWSKGNRPPDWV